MGDRRRLSRPVLRAARVRTARCHERREGAAADRADTRVARPRASRLRHRRRGAGQRRSADRRDRTGAAMRRRSSNTWVTLIGIVLGLALLWLALAWPWMLGTYIAT